MARQWTINGRFLTQPRSGVQRYAAEIVQALDALIADGHPLARDLNVEVLTPAHNKRTLPLRAVTQRMAGRSSGHAWEQLSLPRHCRGGLISLGNTGPVLARHHVVCIHDVNTRVFPASYSRPFRLLYRTLIPLLAHTATRVVTVSEYSADELIRLGIARAAKITVIPNGHEHALRWRAEHSEATRAAAGRNTILVIGSPAPHKNVGLLLGMANRLATSGFRLAIAGASDARVFARKGGERLAASNISWLGRISDNELAALFTDCLCLAFPSFVEGFGLPAIEAMAWGCPVVASDCASLPEVCGEAALYAPPTDPDAWLAQFTKLRKADGLRASLVAKGRAQAAGFSWRSSAVAYLQLMAELDGAAG